MPDAFRGLTDTMALLERHYREMQDIEFTIERGTLYCCRPAPASAPRRRP